MTKKIAIYPGTFDPITIGHFDIIKRASSIFDYLIIAVAGDSTKEPSFSLTERKAMVEHDVSSLANKVIVEAFDGLLVNFAAEAAKAREGEAVIIRGLRAVSDFEYEFQMFGMNARLNPNVQTVFLPASEGAHFISSRFVKEVARLGGDISDFVSVNTSKEIKRVIC